MRHSVLNRSALLSLSDTTKTAQDSQSSFDVHCLRPKSELYTAPDRKENIDDNTHTINTPSSLQLTHKQGLKEVSFNESVRFREIPHHKEMSMKMKTRIWETDQSLQKIRKDACLVVNALNSGLELKADEGERGLYCHTASRKCERHARREKMYDTIYFIQRLQDDLQRIFQGQGSLAKLIAERCRDLNAGFQLEANQQGFDDVRDAAQ